MCKQRHKLIETSAKRPLSMNSNMPPFATIMAPKLAALCKLDKVAYDFYRSADAWVRVWMCVRVCVASAYLRALFCSKTTNCCPPAQCKYIYYIHMYIYTCVCTYIHFLNGRPLFSDHVSRCELANAANVTTCWPQGHKQLGFIHKYTDPKWMKHEQS